MRAFLIGAVVLALGCSASCSQGQSDSVASGGAGAAGTAAGGSSYGAGPGGAASGGTSGSTGAVAGGGSNTGGSGGSNTGGSGGSAGAAGGAAGSGAGLVGDACLRHEDCAEGLACVGGENCATVGGQCTQANATCGLSRCGWASCQQNPDACESCYDCGTSIGCLERQQGCYACVPMP